MDFRLLSYFKRVAELGSVTKAAADLGLSQPALTRNIMRLEHDVRARLFVRGHEGVQLTDAGGRLLIHAEPLLQHAKTVQEEIAACNGALEGDVSLVMPVSMHSTLTLPVLLETKRKFPGIRVHMTDGFDSFLHDQLRDGFADVGVLVYDPDLHIPGVDQQPIAIDRLMLLGRHPIDVEGPLTPSKIAHLPLAMPNQRSGIRRKLDAAFRRAKLSPMILDVDSYQVIMELVDRGEAYSVTPACSAAISAPARESEFWRRPFERLSITWALAAQTKRQSSIVVAQIADLIKAAARDWIDASALSVRASERATSSKASSLAAYRKDKPRIVG